MTDTFYDVTAEHSSGADTGHACDCGIVNDPAETFECQVWAADPDAAARAGCR